MGKLNGYVEEMYNGQSVVQKLQLPGPGQTRALQS